MAAPVTNQNYTQQINQAFDMLKYATPQQMQVVSQQVQQNPNSPEAMALAMAAQYQQQARAPRPQAPQGTILQQKLQEFQQTSPQGLPQVGQNQMAMQQAAQKNPMFGAGLAVAPENTEQAPQQMAATGGITALAHGGEVRGFAGPDGSFANLADVEADSLANIVDEEDIDNAGQMFDSFAKQAKSTGTDLLDKYKSMTAPKGVASAGLPSIDLGGDPSSPYGKYKAPTLGTTISDMEAPTTGGTSPKTDYKSLSDFETAPKTKPKVKAHHSKKDSAPAPGSSAEANAASPTAKGETYQSLNKYLSKGEANPSSYDADSVVSNMLNSDTTPMLNQDEASIANIQKLLGSEADMSEEVGMAREAAANASRDKGLGALVGGIGGMLSAQTPNMGQAVGAGLMSGLSSYQQGAKEQGTADKELMALQMAEKKAKLAPHKEAATMYLGHQAEQAKAAAAANATAAGLRYGLQGDLIKGKQRAGFEQEQQAAKQLHDIDMATQAQIDKLDLIGATGDMKLRVAKLSPAVRQQLLTTVYNRANKEGIDSTELQTLLDEAEKFTYQNKSQPKGMGQSLAPLGSSGVFYSPKK